MANWEKLVLATGSSAQYIKGDGTLGTYSTTDSTKFPLSGGTLTGSMNIFTSSGDANLRLRSGSTRSGVFIDKPNTTSIMGSMLVLASDSSFRLGTASYYHMEMTQSGNTILKGGGSTALTINTSQQATFSSGLAINNASLGSHKFVVDNGTSSLNRGNSAGNILDVRGQNASQMKITTTAFTVTPSSTFASSVTSNGSIIRRANALTNNGIAMLTTDSNHGAIRLYNSTGTLKTQLSSGTNSYILESNLGIGTSSPTHNLNVYNGSGASSMTVGKYASGKTVALLGTSADTSGYFQIQSYASQGSTFGNIVLNPQGGNVGISNSSPASALTIDVADGQNKKGLHITQNDAGEWTSKMDTSGYGLLVRSTATDTTPVLQIQGNGTSNNILYGLANGNVGIGTTGFTGGSRDTDAKLDVMGGINVEAYKKINFDGNGYSVHGFHRLNSITVGGSAVPMLYSFAYYGHRVQNQAGAIVDFGYRNTSTRTLFHGDVEINGGVVINENSNDVDFRVESNTGTHDLFLQGSNGFLGLGIVPQAKFHANLAPNVNFTLSANFYDLRINAVNNATDTAIGLEFNGANYEFLGTGTSTFGGNVTVNGSTTTPMTISADTDKVFTLSSAIGETDNVPTIQTINTAGSSLVGFGVRASEIKLATGSAKRLVIDSSGLVKIGSNDVANAGLRITNQGVVDAKSIIGLGGSNTQPMSAIGGVVESATGNTAGGIYFSTRTSTNNDAPIERMRITSSGNVNIQSTGTPTLFVRNSSASSNSMIHIGEVNTTAYGGEFRYEGNLGNVFIDNKYNHATRPHIYFRMRTAGTPLTALTINSDATTTFGYNATFSSDIYASENIYHNGDTDNKIKFEANKVTLSNTDGTTILNPTAGGASRINVSAIKSLDTNPYKIGGIRTIFNSTAWLSATVSLLGPALTGYGTGIEYLKFDTDGTTKRAMFQGKLGIGTDSGGWGLNIKGADANVFKVQASDGNTLSFLQGINGDATQKWFADGNTTRALINTNGDSYFTGGSLGVGTSVPSSYNNYANNLVVAESGHSGITIVTNGANHTSLYFADGTSGAEAYAGYLDYDHNDNSLDIATNATQAIRIDSSQNTTFAGDVLVAEYIKHTGNTTNYLRFQSNQLDIRNTTTKFVSSEILMSNDYAIKWNSGNTRIYAHEGNNHMRFDVNGTSEVLKLQGTGIATIRGSDGNNAVLHLNADNGDNNADYWRIESTTDNFLRIATRDSGSYSTKFEIGASNGNVRILNELRVQGGLDASEGQSLTGWHTQDKIWVMPSDFMPSTGRNEYNIAMVDNGGEAKTMHAAVSGYVNIPIPSGYKVTHYRLNGTASVEIRAYYSDCTTATATSVMPAPRYTNTEYATSPSSGVEANDTTGRYMILRWICTSTSHRLYGGYVKIAKI